MQIQLGILITHIHIPRIGLYQAQPLLLIHAQVSPGRQVGFRPGLYFHEVVGVGQVLGADEVLEGGRVHLVVVALEFVETPQMSGMWFENYTEY